MAETKEERAARLRKSKETDRARHDRERERELRRLPSKA